MDRYYLLGVIERIESERSVHDKKFQGNQAHSDCLKRFDKTLAMLRDELKKAEGSDNSLSEGSTGTEKA
ncbi:MAG: hypothetical protein C5B53_11685 [Candidatus Melainabacteria bacterium]|nr:MAG: hypothetical protein C5B53_11685 [Candidatus Melainabacteria bacterium]